MTALESVLIGRHPHLAAWQWEGHEDERIALAGAARRWILPIAPIAAPTLSPAASSAASQSRACSRKSRTSISSMSRPTIWIRTISSRCSRSCASSPHAARPIIASLHDPTLAARFADRVLLLFGDGRWRLGPAAEMLTGEALSELYSTPDRGTGRRRPAHFCQRLSADRGAAAGQLRAQLVPAPRESICDLYPRDSPHLIVGQPDRPVPDPERISASTS